LQLLRTVAMPRGRELLTAGRKEKPQRRKDDFTRSAYSARRKQPPLYLQTGN
jgi:hypothetical protein